METVFIFLCKIAGATYHYYSIFICVTLEGICDGNQ